MEFRRAFQAFGSVLQGLFRSRGIQTRLFSGTPVLSRIDMVAGDTPGFSLLFRNGLMLTLGEAGILDYQDRGFGNFIGGPGRSAAPDNREFLVQLHKIVLKSLLRYITHPKLDAVQREFAAEAATKLWMAESLRTEAEPSAGFAAEAAGAEAGDGGKPGFQDSAPAASATASSSSSSSKLQFPNPGNPRADGSWSMGSSRESAPFR